MDSSVLFPRGPRDRGTENDGSRQPRADPKAEFSRQLGPLATRFPASGPNLRGRNCRLRLLEPAACPHLGLPRGAGLCCMAVHLPRDQSTIGIGEDLFRRVHAAPGLSRPSANKQRPLRGVPVLHARAATSDLMVPSGQSPQAEATEESHSSAPGEGEE